MAFHRPSMFAAALLPMSLVACGGGNNGGGTVVPEGTHYHYVVNKALVPTNNTESRAYGLDLNGDGTVDNQLGMVLGTLAGMGFKIQDSLDTAVNDGSIILLADIQTKDFTNAAASGLEVFLGDKATAMPQPCAGSADTTCGKHLQGTGMFTLAANSPMNAALAGHISGGTFDAGPGDITLQIALGGATPITLDLIGARAKLTMMSDSMIGSAIIAGALTQDDLNTKVLPAIQMQLGPLIARDCNMLTMPPGCGCMDGSTGKTILGLFDTSPKDCMVTVDEIKNNSLIQSLLAPDVTIDGKMALSLGVKTTAVKATYTVAGQM